MLHHCLCAACSSQDNSMGYKNFLSLVVLLLIESVAPQIDSRIDYIVKNRKAGDGSALK